MRAFRFIREIFNKFPFLFISTTLSLISVDLFAAGSLLTIGPLVDFLIHPDLKEISPLTVKVVDIMRFLGLPIKIESWFAIFLSFVMLCSILQVVARYFILKTKYSLLRNIFLEASKDFFNARWYFFSSGKQGVLLNMFSREITVVGDAFGSMVIFFANILQLVFALIIPFYISWRVTIISLGIAILFAIPFILLGKVSYRLGILNTRTANYMMSIIHENFSLVKIVLGFGNQQKSIERFINAFDGHRDVTIKSQAISWAIGILYRPFGAITIVLAFFAARRFGVPLSETAVLLLCLLQVALAVGNITNNKNVIDNFFPSYEQIKNLRKRAKELKQTSGNRQFEGFNHELLFKKVSFSYPEQKSVLNDINVRIPKGKMVAFVGESGVGKSTLIDLIMGFNQPTEGSILFDNIPFQDFDTLSYRHKIGYVPQDSVLFNMTVKDNLLWADETASEVDILHACKQANAEEFIKKLPEGYDTLVGDRGVRLSGGQVQRIALARAILRKPQLLILDEATSSLDTYSERLIQQAIEKIAKETTVIVIAHRLSTIVNADYIYVLEAGKVIEEGTYASLVGREGRFNQMVKLQLLEANR